MIELKTKEEIALMQQAGHMVAEVMAELIPYVQVGVSEKEIDAQADTLITQKGGEAGFKREPGWQHATCICTNAVVAHGIPTEYIFKEDDIVGIDCGVYLNGFHSDMCETIRVSSTSSSLDTFLGVGRHALDQAIAVARIGNRIGDISQTIQMIIEAKGYSVVRAFVGHGVGRKLHEDPEVPGFLYTKVEDTPLLEEGMVLAIEVIYNWGTPNVTLDPNGWTAYTLDRKPSSTFERTIAITDNEPLILTV